MARSDRVVNTEIARLRVRWRKAAPPGEKASTNWTTLSLDGALVEALADLDISAKHTAEAILCGLGMDSTAGGPAGTSLSRYVQAHLIRTLGELAKGRQAAHRTPADSALPDDQPAGVLSASHPLSGEAPARSPEAPTGQGEAPRRHTSTGEAPEAPQRPPEGEKPHPLKPAFAEAAKPVLRKGEKPGQWRVLVEGREIGTVTKRHYPKSAGLPAFDRWRADRKGSMLDALSDRTYRTRAQAVEALMQDYGL